MYKRGWLEISVKILSSLEDASLRKTHVANKANIDTRATSKYVAFLLDHKLIEKHEHSLLRITPRGRKFLDCYRMMLDTAGISDYNVINSAFNTNELN